PPPAVAPELAAESSLGAAAGSLAGAIVPGTVRVASPVGTGTGIAFVLVCGGGVAAPPRGAETVPAGTEGFTGWGPTGLEAGAIDGKFVSAREPPCDAAALP